MSTNADHEIEAIRLRNVDELPQSTDSKEPGRPVSTSRLKRAPASDFRNFGRKDRVGDSKVSTMDGFEPDTYPRKLEERRGRTSTGAARVMSTQPLALTCEHWGHGRETCKAAYISRRRTWNQAGRVRKDETCTRTS